VAPVRVTNALSRLAVQKQPLAMKTYQGIPGGSPSIWELTAAGQMRLAGG
jgi:hypothetical protein